MAKAAEPLDIAIQTAKEWDKLQKKSKEITVAVGKDFTDLSKQWAKVLREIGERSIDDFTDLANVIDEQLIAGLKRVASSSFPEAIKQSKKFVEQLKSIRTEWEAPELDPVIKQMEIEVEQAELLNQKLLNTPELRGKFESAIAPAEKLAIIFSRIPLVGGLFERRMTAAITRIRAEFQISLDEWDGSAEGSAKVIRNTWGAALTEIGDNLGTIISGLLLAGVAKAGATIWKRFMAVQDTLKKVADNTGIVNEQLRQAESQIVKSNISLAQYGVTLEVAGSAWQAIYNVTGNTQVITQKLVDTAALMISNLGMVADDAANVLLLFRSVSNSTDQVATNMTAAVAQASLLAGVAPKRVLTDMAKNAKFLQIYFRGSEQEMAKAAIHAQRIGLSLDTTSRMTEKLLDWDTAIENEMNASVMLGKQINFQRARQLMFEGKIKEATDEVMKQIPRLDEWNKLNYLQKKAIADAAGMEVTEISNSLKQQEKLSKLSYRDRVNYEKSLLVLEDMKNANEDILKTLQKQTQIERLSQAWDKLVTVLTQLFVPILEFTVDLLTSILRVTDDIVDSIINMFSPAKDASSAVETVSTGFSDMLPAVLLVGAAISALFGVQIAAGAVAAIESIGGVIIGMTTWVAETWAAVTAQGALNAAMMANPVGLIVAGVLVLIAAVLLLIKHWDDVVAAFESGAKFMSKIITATGKVFTDIWDGIKSVFTSTIDWIVNTAEKYGKFVIMALFPISAVYFYWDQIKQIFSDAVNWIIDKISSLPIIGPLFKGLMSAAGAIGSVISSVVPFAQGGVVTQPTLGLVGEKPEAIIPLDKAARTPAVGTDNEAVVKKIDELINVMRTGFAVYLDGKKVGDAIIENYPHPLAINA